MSDDELVEALDNSHQALAFIRGEQDGTPSEVIWSELNQRRADRRAAKLEVLTWAIAAMTLVSTIFVALAALKIVG